MDARVPVNQHSCIRLPTTTSLSPGKKHTDADGRLSKEGARKSILWALDESQRHLFEQLRELQRGRDSQQEIPHRAGRHLEELKG